MKFITTNIDGVYRVCLEPLVDERGFFARAWCREEFVGMGIEVEPSQVNLAYTHQAGTLRGLHLQRPPHAETKYVRCIRGAAWVVAVDLRPQSPTFCQWTSLELTADNRDAMIVPKGFAQGYQTLCDDTEMMYQMSTPYVPEAAWGYRYDDPAFAIDWPSAPVVISARDLSWPPFDRVYHDETRHRN